MSKRPVPKLNLLRHLPGEAASKVAAVVGSEFIDIRDIAAQTGLERNTVRRCLLSGEYEVRKHGTGRGRAMEARRRQDERSRQIAVMRRMAGVTRGW